MSVLTDQPLNLDELHRLVNTPGALMREDEEMSEEECEEGYEEDHCNEEEEDTSFCKNCRRLIEPSSETNNAVLWVMELNDYVNSDTTGFPSKQLFFCNRKCAVSYYSKEESDEEEQEIQQTQDYVDYETLSHFNK